MTARASRSARSDTDQQAGVQPFAPGEEVVVNFGPAYVSARVVATNEHRVELVCEGGSTVRSVPVMRVFRPGPEVDELIAKRAEPGVTQWDLSPLLSRIYATHPAANLR